MSNPQHAAGQAWAQRRAEPKTVVTYSEPPRYRPALTKCSGCSCWVPDTVPLGRHGVHYASRDGSPTLINCSGVEVAP